MSQVSAKKALICGITGQDGSYLTEFLLAKGYEVHGIVRRTSTFNTDRLDHIYADPHEHAVPLFLHYGDLANAARLRHLLEQIQPDEVYNLGAQSHVRVSFDQAEYTADIVATGTLRLLEAFRDYASGRERRPRFLSGRLVGNVWRFAAAAERIHAVLSPQSVRGEQGGRALVRRQPARSLRSVHLERHPVQPRIAAPGRDVRDAQDHARLGRIKLGLQDKLYLGNLDARRDWGHAADYVRAMWLMLQQDSPDDFVVATGANRSVSDFLDLAASYAGVDWRTCVEKDPRYFRPTEVDALQGDPSKARRVLGWKPEISFEELVRSMVENDMELARQELTLVRAGHRVAPRGGAHG